jgi:DNA polymerase III subunit gamma/tau
MHFMSSVAPHSDAPEPSGAAPQYVVVARRYRPQTFSELIGQEHVAQALSNAIATNRVGHAYLFTGARGVGKTSAARILAKALNCEKGPIPVPCNQCDICQSISTGEDVDVLEIDGASNRGIDEIRQLRQNVNVRPSRSRYKIYIIDEVHMLTREAFNALLKTLEEPPEHVKFIFCTTEATKIPITILSRCQRFDFAGILTNSIRERLRQIVQAEGVEADPDALEVIARRAAGSMRDSQSLLEQLLSFSPGRVTLAEVHGMLGTAGDERLNTLTAHLVKRDAAGALAEFDTAVNAGVDASQLVEQLFGYFRDCMAAVVGCPNDALLYTSPSDAPQVVETGKQLGLHTLLAVMQILDQSLSRMRYSTQGRIIAELALVRISHLEDLDEIASLITQLQSGTLPAPASHGRPASASIPATSHAAAKKKLDPPVTDPAADPPALASATTSPSSVVDSAPVTQAPASPQSPAQSPAIEITAANVAAVWEQALAQLSGMSIDHARQCESVTWTAPNRITVRFNQENAFSKSLCERPEQTAKLEQALADVAGQRLRVEFALNEATGNPTQSAAPVKVVSAYQRKLEVMKHPMVQKAIELFGAQVDRVDDPSP